MTEHGPAAASAADGTPLMTASEELKLPDRILKGLADTPDHAGELLIGFATELAEAGQGDQARRVLETVREHPPTAEDRQYASVELVKVLREGQNAQDAAEAERLTEDLLRPGRLGEGPAQLFGEDLQALERWEEALRCFNVAARQLLAHAPEELEELEDVALLPLTSRLLARMNLGLPYDGHDEVALDVAHRQVEGLPEFPGTEGEDWQDGAWWQGGRRDGGSPDQEMKALYSRAAFDDARTRGLLNGQSSEHGADAYYRAAELALREQARELPATRWSVVLHGVAEIVEFAELSEVDPAERDLPQEWAALEVLADDPRLRTWPPGRNETCWCASGRKYKKCCGSPANR